MGSTDAANILPVDVERLSVCRQDAGGIKALSALKILLVKEKAKRTDDTARGFFSSVLN